MFNLWSTCLLGHTCLSGPVHSHFSSCYMLHPVLRGSIDSSFLLLLGFKNKIKSGISNWKLLQEETSWEYECGPSVPRCVWTRVVRMQTAVMQEVLLPVTSRMHSFCTCLCVRVCWHRVQAQGIRRFPHIESFFSDIISACFLQKQRKKNYLLHLTLT